MKEDEIRRLVQIVEESNITEIEISQTRWGKRTIKISKTPSNSHMVTNSATHHLVPTSAPVRQPESAKQEVSFEDPKIEKAALSHGVEIKSPMVGTFYRSPAPDAEPYVKENQTVKKGQVLCIIEAMKLMNEIESEVDGRVVQILVESGQPVEYNQPLFT